MRLLWLIAALLLLASGVQHFEKPRPALWVEVHDLSPGYATMPLERLLDITGGRAERVVVFVIPRRGGVEPISEYPEFVDFLRRLEDRGVEVGAHGLTHRGFEFLTTREGAAELTAAVRREFRRAGFEPRVFSPPRYLVSPQALEQLSWEYHQVYLLDGVVCSGGFLPYYTREFTAGREQRLLMPLARLSLLLTRSEVYRLSVHMAYLNNESLRFLQEFLSWAGFEAESRSCDEELAAGEALRMEPPPQVRGVKRNAYALLYAANMYTATGEERYRAMAERYASYLLTRQEEGGGWREAEGEATSSYALLESAAATWALSQAYTSGAIAGGEVEAGIRRGGDALLRRTELLTFFGCNFGLRPNAIGFAALGLEKAAEAAQLMGEPLRAEDYRRKAVEVGECLLKMQLRSGAWYDGPYRLPWYSWRSVSAWYQGMALSGVAAAYAAAPPGERLGFRESAERGAGFLERMRRGDGGYYGVLHANGTPAGDGSIMVLQAYAIAESFGLRFGCGALNYTASGVKNWDANYAFAVSQFLANARVRDERDEHRRAPC
ncbi:MAG: DUF2334 domain-containing protein [Euryarchaeota archaeon]|nr:DUF2334 domain-containing protein [Euryarchaeota archaeon]